MTYLQLAAGVSRVSLRGQTFMGVGGYIDVSTASQATIADLINLLRCKAATEADAQTAIKAAQDATKAASDAAASAATAVAQAKLEAAQKQVSDVAAAKAASAAGAAARAARVEKKPNAAT